MKANRFKNRMRNAKRLFLAAIAMMIAGGAEAAIGITVDSATQRYPWNGIVDITYTLTIPDGVAPLSVLTNQIEFLVTDNSKKPAVTYIAADFDKVVPMTAGQHHLTWNANRNGIVFNSANVSVSARVRTFKTKYMIIDLAGGLDETTGKYKITYADSEPEGGFTNEVYKGDKMVFRFIPPGNFKMGSPTTESGRNAANEAQRMVALTKPFYIGIYEVTQKQFEYVMGASKNNSGNRGAYRPMEKICWRDIRGNGVSTYPTDKTVSSTSFVGVMRARTGIDIDLPSDAQWEYACRAGTTTAFNDGLSQDYGVSMKALGRYSGNTSDGKGGYTSGTTTVGSYKPNNWGLYDMHGNVYEWVLDGYCAAERLADQTVDPVGLANDWRIQRGGGYTWGDVKACRSAYREAPANGTNAGNAFIGFRVAAPVADVVAQ